MMDALRSYRQPSLLLCGLTAIVMALPSAVAWAQQTVIIGGPANGSGVEVNLNAIYGAGGAPSAVQPGYPIAGRSDRLLIPNLHDPDTGQIIGSGTVRLVPPNDAPAARETASRVPSPQLRRPSAASAAMSKPVMTKPSMTAPAVPSAQSGRTVSAPPVPTPPPIQPAKPMSETAMADKEPAGTSASRPPPVPSPPPIRSLTRAEPPKSVTSSAPKRMPEPPALPPAPSVTTMAKSAKQDNSMADKAMSDRATSDKTMAGKALAEESAAGKSMADKPMAQQSRSAVPPPPPPPAIGTAPASSASPRVASLSPSGDATHQLRFGAGSAALSTDAEAVLKSFAESMKNSEDRVQLRAYADKSGGNDSKARRLSLSRALAVRSYLIESGLRSTRIDVRALGSVPDGGPADRVDVIRLER